MVKGQVNPIISIIIDDINNNNNDNSNFPLNGFQHQFLQWGRRNASVHINCSVLASKSL